MAVRRSAMTSLVGTRSLTRTSSSRAHHRHELGLRRLLQHVALEHDPVADAAGRRDVLGLVLRRRHGRRVVGDEHAHLLDGAELQLVEPLTDRAGPDDDLDEVVDVPRSIGAVRLRQPCGHELGLLELVTAVVDQRTQRDARWRSHPAARHGGRLCHQSLPLQPDEAVPDLRARELAPMGQVIDAGPTQPDERAVELRLLGARDPTLRALPPWLLSVAPSLHPGGWRTCAMAHIRRTSHSSGQTGPPALWLATPESTPASPSCSVTRTAGSRTTSRRTSMRPIWRNTLGVATVAIVAATAAAPTSAFGQDSGATPRPIVGSSAAQAATGSPKTVTLITGDKVLVTGAGTNAPIVTVLPREDGSVPSVETRRVGKDVYVYPADAADALSSGKVDEELFNVTGLVAMGYDDASTDTVPVIARYTTDLSRARSAPTTPKGAAKGATLHSIDGIALKADKDQASDFFADVTDPVHRCRAPRSRRSGWTRKAYATPRPVDQAGERRPGLGRRAQGRRHQGRRPRHRRRRRAPGPAGPDRRVQGLHRLSGWSAVRRAGPRHAHRLHRRRLRRGQRRPQEGRRPRDPAAHRQGAR